MQLLSPTTEAPPVAACAREVLDAAPILIWYVRLHMRRHRKGLSIPQFRALVKIRNEPAASLSAVAEHLGGSLPTASRTVATLVAKGLASRAPCTRDRRQCALTLTPRGRRIVENALAATQAQMEAELSGLSPAQRATVREAMALLLTAFDRAKRRHTTAHASIAAPVSARRTARSAAPAIVLS